MARDIFFWIKDNSAIIAIDLILTGLLIYPLLIYVAYGWARKAAEIDNSLSDWAKQTYLRIFQQQDVKVSDAGARFSAIYQDWYGRKWFFLPIALVTIIAIVENYLLASHLLRLAADTKLQIAPAAVAGAYTFVVWDFFARVQRRNLSIADILRGGLRLAIAIPVGYAFAALLQPDVGAFIAFAVGVFPLSTVSTFLRQIANKRLGLEIGPAKAEFQVAQLSGIDAAIADRIEDADVTTIPQLAWCDPIQLTMRTNLSFAFVVDICSQALAWVYLDNKLEKLRSFGLRGAFEIRVLLEDLESEHEADKACAEAVLPVAATAAGLSLAGLRYACEQIAYDTHTQFLYDALTPLIYDTPKAAALVRLRKAPKPKLPPQHRGASPPST